MLLITHPCDPIGLECQEERGHHWDAEELKIFSFSVLYLHDVLSQVSGCRM